MNKKNVLIFLIISFLSLGSVAWASSPEINDIFRKIDSAESFYYKNQTKITIEDLSNKTGVHTLDLKVNGVVLDQNQVETVDSAASISFEYNGNLLNNWIGEKKFVIGGEYKYKADSKTSYFCLRNFSEYLNDYLDLAKNKDIWNEFSNTEIKNSGSFQMFYLLPILLSSDINLSTDYDDSETTSTEKTIKNEQIKEAFYDADILELTEPVADTVLENQPAQLYKFKVNESGIIDYIKTLSEINGETMTADELVSITEKIQLLTFDSGELIVNDKVVSLVLGFKYEDSENGLKLSTKTTNTLSRFNDPNLIVKAPEINKAKTDLNKEQLQDQRVFSDIRQIQTALELYYNDASRYPEKIISGQPLVFDDITYIQKIPTAPERTKNSSCFGKQYKYTVNATGRDYKLEYCLKNNTGSVHSGINIATSAGIQSGKALSEKEIKAENLKTEQKQYSDLETEANRPRAAIQKSSNNLRISNKVSSDIVYLQQILEGYYDDVGQYPSSLIPGQALKYGQITYIKKIPTHLQYTKPTICNKAKFIYQPIKTKGKVTDYSLQYCREKKSSYFFGETPAGKLKATKDGLGYNGFLSL